MELVKWNKAKQAIIEAKTIDEVKEIRDKAQAMQAYAKQIGESLEMQNNIAEIKIRAERRAGEMLRETERQKPGEYQRSHDVTVAPKLSNIGVTKSQSSRWQATASLPEEIFEEHIAEIKTDKKELTSAGVTRLANVTKRKVQNKQLKEQPAPTEKYRILLCDPPWRYGDQQHSTTEQDTILETHYPTMSISELCELPIKNICEENAVLFLWVTSPLLAECFDVINAWNFKYKTSMVWDKVKHNVGNYVSVRHEFLLICTKGSCLPDVKKLYDSVVSIERTKHSEKPEYFRELIDEIYPYGKRIELFARTKNRGWDTYGNDPLL